MLVVHIFDTSEESDREELELRGKALAMIGCLEEFDHYLRGRLKHEVLSDDAHEALEKAREALYDSMDSHGITLYE